MYEVNCEQILKTKVKYKNNQFEISSIIVHSRHGMSFETMIFADDELKDPFEQYEERYDSKDKMLKRHKEIVKLFRENRAEEVLQ